MEVSAIIQGVAEAVVVVDGGRRVLSMARCGNEWDQ